jgi:hypothetical protein
MRPSRRKALLREGRTLFRALGLPRPTGLQLRTYARAIGPTAAALDLTGLHRHPAALSLMQPIPSSGTLSDRLYVAALLVDMSADAHRVAYDYDGVSRAGAWLSLAALLLRESVVTVARVVMGRGWRP